MEFIDYPYDQYPIEAYDAVLLLVVDKLRSMSAQELHNALVGVRENILGANDAVWFITGSDSLEDILKQHDDDVKLGYDIEKSWKSDYIIDNLLRYMKLTYPDEKVIEEFRDGDIWQYETQLSACEKSALDAISEYFIGYDWHELLDYGLVSAGYAPVQVKKR